MEKEEWCDIIDYENLYQCSNLGRIKSLGNGDSNNSKERILKQGINKKGYCVVVLCKEGKCKSHLVHRIVATAFISNIENKPHIDHIDTNKQNNNVNNLRWVTQKQNCNNPITKDKLSKALKGKIVSQEHKNKLSKPILQLSKRGNIILRKWDSLSQVERELGICHSNICECCNGKRKTAKGYKWMYYDDYINKMNNYFNLALKEVS